MSEVATAKQTGGGGILYEDRVNAYFMACMLTGTPPFNINHGTIEKIKFQVRADGWYFDDALLYCKMQSNNLRIAVSIKSSQQFTSNGIPTGLNELLWKQFLKVESSVFDKHTDFLCLVEPSLPPGLSGDLNSLLTQIYKQEPGDMAKRQYAQGFNAASTNKIYNSFQSPSDLSSKYAVSPEQTDSLIKRFIHQQMDFESVNSFSEKITIDLCRKAVKSKNMDEATRLYESLCHIARQQAPAAGFVDISKLVQLLGGNYLLEDFPEHSADWKKLNAYTAAKLDVIQENIDGTLSFPRNDSIKQFQEVFKGHQALALHGFSGSGKTVAAKKFAQAAIQSNDQVIWLDSGDFEVHSLQTSLGLTSPPSELFGHVTAQKAYLIIDGAEKIYNSQQQQRLAMLLNSVFKQSSSPWKILLTCPSENLSWLLETLNRNNVNISALVAVPIGDLKDEDVSLMIEAYPQLAPFFINERIRLLFRNLKLLDKVITIIKHINLPKNTEFGETELIDLIWDEEITKTANGLQKAAFIKLLAEKQADAMALSISSSEFSVADMAPADELLKTRFIKTHNERFLFTHDLYGDWALYKLILSNSSNLQTFLGSKHLSSPLWTRAFRYYAISLLEKEPEKNRWLETYRLYAGKSSQQVIIQDLMLEALFFSNNALEHLQRIREFLFENNGEQLRRVITLFHLRATTVNQEILTLVRNAGYNETLAIDVNRVPIWNYWADMMQFLHLNLDRVIELDGIGAGKLAHTWLSNMPARFLLRKEASDIAIKAFDKISATRPYINDDLKKTIYEALLLGIAENPKEVKQRCLAMCKRVEPKQRSEKQESTETGHVSILDQLGIPKREPLKWEDGPYSSVDSVVQAICLDTQAIYQVIRHDPALATEMLLAVLIDEPQERYFGSTYNDDYSMHEPHGWYPPFFNRGPFLNYFRLNPMEALKFTLKIVDFATERRLDEHRYEGNQTDDIMVQLDGEWKIYKGDQAVFAWHKDIGTAPHSLVSILMAFEQFLYEKIENKESINEYVDYAIRNTNSLAIVGLLLVVAKIQPSLYKKELQRLLSVYELYPWDLHTRGHDVFSLWGELPRPWREEAEKWKKRSHRYFPLKDAILRIWLSDKELQDIYKTITPQWGQRLKRLKEDGYTDPYLIQMIPQFQLENWEFRQSGSYIEVEYKEPQTVTELLKSGRESSLETLSVGNYAFRCDQMMREKLEIAVQEAEAIWSQLQKYLSSLREEKIDDDLDLSGWASPCTNIMAAMACLVHFKKAWIEMHPEYYGLIKEFCVSVTNKELAKESRFDTPGTHHDWNIFLAIIASHLWIDNEKDPDCRTLLAGAVVHFTSETIERLLVEAEKYLHWHNPAFIQLQNFILQFSGEYHDHIAKRRSGESSFLPIKQKLVKEFADDLISRQPSNWSDMRIAEKKTPKGKRSRRDFDEDDFTRDPGLYSPVLKHFLKALPTLEQARNTEERTHILFILKQSIEQVIYELGEIKEDAKEIDQYPNEFNLVVLQRIPSILSLLTEQETPESFWKPLFSYGYIAATWIDIFSTQFFLLNLEKKDRYEPMIKILKDMVEFSYASPTWNFKHIRKREDFRLCILGMQPRMISVWNDDLSSFMEKAGSIYEEWFLKKKFNPYAVSALLDFVITSSGTFMLKASFPIFQIFFGLGQLHAQADPTPGFTYIGTPEHDKKLAVVLDYTWKQKKHILTSDSTVLKIFKDLVQYLVALKNPVALALQNDLLIEG